MTQPERLKTAEDHPIIWESPFPLAWQYQVVSRRHCDQQTWEGILNALGLEGWELVSVDDGDAYFKRRRC